MIFFYLVRKILVKFFFLTLTYELGTEVNLTCEADGFGGNDTNGDPIDIRNFNIQYFIFIKYKFYAIEIRTMLF